MSRTDTWMPLYIGDYLADTGRLTTLGHGAYMLILMDYWRNGAPPDDDSALAAIARVDRKIWDRELRTVIRSFFKLGDDGLLHQKRLDSERAHAIDLSEKRRLAALQKRKQSTTDQGPDQEGPTGESRGGENGSKDPSKQEQLLSNRSAIAQQQADDSAPIDELEECNTTHTRASRPYALPSPSPSKKEDPDLRSDAVASISDAKAEVWGAGLKALCLVTGLSDAKARPILGRLRKTAKDDYPAILRALRDAVEIRPSDPVAWLNKAVLPRDKPAARGSIAWMAKHLNPDQRQSDLGEIIIEGTTIQ